MAFKQKTGSPFQRNFGVGKSPAKHSGSQYRAQVKERDGIDVRPQDVKGHDKDHRDNVVDENHNPVKKAPGKMKSPAKQTSPMKDNSGQILARAGGIYNDKGEKTGDVDVSPGSEAYIAAKAHDQRHHDYKSDPNKYPAPHTTTGGVVDKEKSSEGWSDRARRSEMDKVLPMKKSGFKMKSSPFQKFGEIVDVDLETQISSSDVKQEKDDIMAAQTHRDELKKQNPTSSVEYLDEQADIFLEKLNPEKYGQFGYSKGTGRTKVEFRGLEKYTNELSPHYDADINTVQDIKDKYSVEDETGGLVVRDSEAYNAISWEEKPGAKEKTESQKQLDRDVLLDEEG